MIEIRCEEGPVRSWKWWRIYVDGKRLLGHWNSQEDAQSYLDKHLQKAA